MRQCWVRDIADFAKYGLLKRLAGADLRLGVFWYLTTHAAPNKPLVSYLWRPDEYQRFDPSLFDTLCHLHNAKRDALTLDDIERGGVLPNTTVFYAAPLATSVLDRAARAENRRRWFEDGLTVTTECDIILLDPDTGLLPPRRKVENSGGEEYATLDEILALCRRGQCVVTVQFGAPQNFESEPVKARERLAMLRAALTARGLPEPFGLWWRDGHKVGLLVAPCEKHGELLRARRDAILADARWSKKVAGL